LFVSWELFHREICVRIFVDTFQQIHISRRCHTEIHVALKYSEPCRATLLTVNWEQVTHGFDNYCLLLTFYEQTPMQEPHCPPYNIILCRRLQINYFPSKRYRPSSMLSHWQNLRALRGRRWTCSGEAQSRELVNSFKNVPVLRGLNLAAHRPTTVQLTNCNFRIVA
jgi:hypothetical protein